MAEADGEANRPKYIFTQAIAGPRMQAAAESIFMKSKSLTPMALREQSKLRGLSVSSLNWEPPMYGTMTSTETRREKITNLLNVHAKIQAKKQHDLLAATPEGAAKAEMRRVLKLNKMLGVGGPTRAVQARQHFQVTRQRSTDGGKTLPFTLNYALVSAVNLIALGSTVQVKGKKWPVWKVSMLEQDIADERIQLPHNLGTPVGPRILRDLLKTLDYRYEHMILKNQMQLVSGMRDTVSVTDTDYSEPVKDAPTGGHS